MKRALVIEDNEDNMELITIILEKNGFTTYRAENGKRGIGKDRAKKLGKALNTDYRLLL